MIDLLLSPLVGIGILVAGVALVWFMSFLMGKELEEEIKEQEEEGPLD